MAATKANAAKHAIRATSMFTIERLAILLIPGSPFLARHALGAFDYPLDKPCCVAESDWFQRCHMLMDRDFLPAGARLQPEDRGCDATSVERSICMATTPPMPGPLQQACRAWAA